MTARALRAGFAGFVLFLLSWTCVQASQRIALVIGNSGYSNVPFLPNAAQDARDVAEALRQLGFDVFDGYDLNRVDMLQLTSRMSDALQPDAVALFYFSGHGIQIGAENFVLPVDARGDDEVRLKASSVSLQTILREMEMRADRNIVILDACRNNPFLVGLKARSVGGASRGLARIDAGVGSYIAFSTQPGNVALDGNGRNSPFTEALLTHLSEPDDDLHAMMRKVRSDVVSATDGSQVPWENSSLIEEIFLGSDDGRAAGEKAAQSLVAAMPQLKPATVPPAPATRDFSWRVTGLDPGGDGFLALRSGAASNASMIGKLSEGTALAVLGVDGAWIHVATEAGQEGWAHSNWIRQANRSTAPAAAEDQCQSLWLARNTLFDKYGYCFTSARGKAAFSNADCIAGVTAANAPLTVAERAEVARIAALEKSFGCH
ncbi:caspase family protein [Martelella sp. HB161492]|uniref:caspase family protein n=1 Tax=Martelella sp. HB161492 TaxID=2720726 RepID=UPI00159134B2|nr:caspase family protein [Martelella sp. HB161492]